MTDGKVRYYTGRKLRAFLKQERQGFKSKKAREFKGQIANAGKATGRVKIGTPYTFERLNLKKGDVLVTGMTTPESVIYIKKALAIITDEGGMLCHAAIISRELGIPCIIGTKIATQVLKDGDLVDVDANKGVVKIIKRV